MPYERKEKVQDIDEAHLCLIMSITEKEVKPRTEPNLYRLITRYPYANAYHEYKQSGKKFGLGTFKQYGGTGGQQSVIVLFAQYYPGHSRFPNDSASKRKEWFSNALKQLTKVRQLDSVAFDYGNLVEDCGVDLDEYQQLIDDFSSTYQLNHNTSVTPVIYRDPETVRPTVVKETTDRAARKISPMILRRNLTLTSKPVARSKLSVQAKEAIALAKEEDLQLGKEAGGWLGTEETQVSPTKPMLDLSKAAYNQTVLTPASFCRYQLVDEFNQISLRQLANEQSASDWSWLFTDTIIASKLDQIPIKLEDNVFPASNLIFNAFNLCSSSGLKVVLLGQDPYPTRGNAHGLSFSVPMGVNIPKSLVNVYKAMSQDPLIAFEIPDHGCLESWAKQGVLLLNAALTVTEGQAGAHSKHWEPITDRMIQLISQQHSNLVFMLWGGFAKKKKRFIQSGKGHLVLEFSHPSPLSANRLGFDCMHFGLANQYIEEKGCEPIDWQL